jgi:hypothetical protein
MVTPVSELHLEVFWTGDRVEVCADAPRRCEAPSPLRPERSRTPARGHRTRRGDRHESTPCPSCHARRGELSIGLAAEHPHHLVAVARALALKVLPLLRALVDAHVLHGEGRTEKRSCERVFFSLRSMFPQSLALDVVVRGLLGGAGTCARGGGSTACGRGARCVLTASMPIQRRPRRSAASRVVPDPMKQSSTRPPGRARRRDDAFDTSATWLLRGVAEATVGLSSLRGGYHSRQTEAACHRRLGIA